MNTIQKQARNDAREYARAKMYYGEGAGNRRKLIEKTVEAKGAKNPMYAREFHRELSKQDWAEHATKARRERERKDVGRALSLNSRGLATGNYANVNTAVLLIAAGAYFAHKNGLDKKYYGIAKARVNTFRDNRKARKLDRKTGAAQHENVHTHPTAARVY